MIWIPEGLAHGFRVLSDVADVFYKSTGFYAPECERTIAWNDPDLAIDWQLTGNPVVSGKDAKERATATRRNLQIAPCSSWHAGPLRTRNRSHCLFRERAFYA
jgi:hypothetical protein